MVQPSIPGFDAWVARVVGATLSGGLALLVAATVRSSHNTHTRTYEHTVVILMSPQHPPPTHTHTHTHTHTR